jgi:murein DD-endopeptidase MepM/ murein hydrolase activator NlpD
MTVRRFLAVTLAICAAPAAQSRSAPQAEVRWIPERPPQGSLVLVETGAEAMGTLADEPLHFERVGARYRALAAIPLAADDTVRGTLTVAGVTQPLAIPVAQRDAPNERLRTADRFTRPPDAALEARLERERAQVRAVLAATHERPRLWHEPFQVPVPGRLISAFGSSRTFNATVQSRHRGADLSGTLGDTVRAANRGVVVLVADHFYAGRSVWLDHGAGLLTAYLHFSAALVAVGDTVAAGQPIGRVGRSGRVTAPHLHWSALYGRVGFDPLELLGPRALALLGDATPD